MRRPSITKKDLARYFHCRRREAAAYLNISGEVLKTVSRAHGIRQWPNKLVEKINIRMRHVSLDEVGKYRTMIIKVREGATERQMKLIDNAVGDQKCYNHMSTEELKDELLPYIQVDADLVANELNIDTGYLASLYRRLLVELVAKMCKA